MRNFNEISHLYCFVSALRRTNSFSLMCELHTPELQDLLYTTTRAKLETLSRTSTMDELGPSLQINTIKYGNAHIQSTYGEFPQLLCESGEYRRCVRTSWAYPTLYLLAFVQIELEVEGTIKCPHWIEGWSGERDVKTKYAGYLRTLSQSLAPMILNAVKRAWGSCDYLVHKIILYPRANLLPKY